MCCAHQNLIGIAATDSPEFRSLVYSLREGIVIADPDENVSFSNPAADRVFGVAPGSLANHNLREFLDDDAWKTLLAQSALRHEGTISSYELALIRADGQLRTLSLAVSPLRDDQGAYIGSLGQIRDITEQKAAEREQLEHISFLEVLEQVDQVIRQAPNMDSLLEGVLTVIHHELACDRAWLIHPVDPHEESFKVLFEITRAEWPGASDRGQAIPITPAIADLMRFGLIQDGPITWGMDEAHAIPKELAEAFSVQSLLTMPLVVKHGKPWALGIHQCSHQRQWTLMEQTLVKQIGRRLADGLSSMIILEGLRESERSLREAQQIARISNWTHDLLTDTITVSSEVFSTLGVDLAGQGIEPSVPDFMSRIHPEDRHIVETAIEESQLGKAEANHEFRIVQPSGEIRWMHNRWVSTFDANGREIKRTGTNQDITQQKQHEDKIRRDAKRLSELNEELNYSNDELVATNEELEAQYQELTALNDSLIVAQGALKEREGKYRKLVESVNTVPWELDLQSDLFTYVGPQTETILGRPLSDWTDFDSWVAMIHPEDRERALQQCIDFKEDAEEFSFEYRLIHGNGQTIWVKDFIQVVRNETGLLKLVGLMVDISELKQAELKLRDSEANLRSILRVAPVGIGVVVDRVLTQVNERLSEMTGYTREEMVGERSRVFYANDEDYNYVGSEKYDQIRKLGTGTVETRWLRKDGQIINVLLSSTPIDHSDLQKGVIFTALDITEQKQAEKALRDSEEHYKNFFENALVGLFRTRISDGTYLELNSTAAQISQLPRDAIIGNISTMDLYQDPEQRAELLKQLQENGEVHGFEIDMTLHGGREVTFSLSVRAYPEEDYLEGAVIDITSRKLAEAALTEKTAYLDSVLSSSTGFGIIVTDLNLKIIYFNPGAEITFGYQAADVIGMTVNEVHADLGVDTSRLSHAFSTVGETGEYRFSIQTESEDGVKYIDSVISGIRDPQGRLLGYVLISEDVTNRKQTEDQLRPLVTAIQQAAEAVVITDLDGLIQYVNPAFTRITGYEKEEAIGKNPNILKSGHQDDAFYKVLWETIVSGKPWHGRLANFKKDGTLFHEDTTITPIFDPAGQIVNYVAVKRDITQEITLEDQLRQTQKLEAIGTLAGGIAHDFNNVLFGILGYSELTLEALPEDSKAREYVREIVTGGRRAASLVKQILTFARKTEKQRSVLEITPLLKEAIQLLRSTIPTTIEIRFQTDTISTSVLADPTEIHQVVMNLCTNAAHAMREQGGVLSIHLSEFELSITGLNKHPSLKPGPYLKLEISDTGPGIPPEVQARIFEPFFTTKQAGEGTGMGLAVVHGIVTEMHGSIDVTSEPDQGTTFSVYLPIMNYTQSFADPLRGVAPRGTEHIMVVDDEAAVSAIAEQLLMSLGYTVTTMDSGPAALAAFRLKPQKYDLVITDQTMPKLTGDELAKELLAIRPDLPIVLCTGYSHTFTAEQARQCNIREFILKPLTKTELAAVVRTVLDATDAKP